MNSIRWRLYVIAFLAGFSLMVFELVAARILAPSIGSSTYIWTSVIGVIVTALSLGYFVGGKLADRRSRLHDISYISLLASVMVVLTMSSYLGVLEWAVSTLSDSRMQGLVASLVLFAPVSVLLGMLQPYLVKQNVRSLEESGQSVANLSALDAIGGIVGTFMAGFLLFGFLGSRETLLVVALILLVISWLIAPKKRVVWRLTATAAVVLFGIAPLKPSATVASIDTPTAHYEVVEGFYGSDIRHVRGLMTDPTSVQSAIYTDNSNELVFWYNQQLAKIVELAPSKDRILVLGGGVFTLPQYLANTYPDSTIDVVEVDPELRSIAKEYFNYKSPENVNLIFNDARAYVNSANTKYDIIIADVYGGSAVPFNLTTREYGNSVASLGHKNTVVAANIIAGDSGACAEQLSYLAAPYRPHYKYANFWAEGRQITRENIIAVFYNQPLDSLPSGFTPNKVEPFSDNYAPAERLHQACNDYDNAVF